MTRGEVLRIIRKKRGYTQDQLAEMSGVSKAQVSQAENNVIGKGSALVSISKSLEVPLVIIEFIIMDESSVCETKRELFTRLHKEVANLAKKIFEIEM